MRCMMHGVGTHCECQAGKKQCTALLRIVLVELLRYLFSIHGLSGVVSVLAGSIWTTAPSHIVGTTWYENFKNFKDV